MTRPYTSPILSELRSPSSPEAQVSALTALKNEIIGHEQKKELWISLGVVASLARILNTHRSGSKKRQKEHNGGVAEYDRQGDGSAEEDARLQAILVVGSLAQGGPAYLPPLVAGQVFPPLLSILCPAESSTSMILAVLRTLNTVADSASLECSQGENKEEDALRTLYTDQNLGYITQILNQASSTRLVQEQISLAASLIAKTCKDESRRKQVAQTEIIEALATRLAAFIVATDVSDAKRTKISPATTRYRLAPILQAIGTVITDSRARTFQFVGAPVFSTVFARHQGTGQDDSQAANDASNVAMPSWAREDVPHQTSNFPPLGGMATWGKPKPNIGLNSPLDLQLIDISTIADDGKSPLVYWLARVVRDEPGHGKLMVAWVLALLFRFGIGGKKLEKIIALQLIPVLVQLLEPEDVSKVPPQPCSDPLQAPKSLIIEQAPRVIALLVEDNETLQQAASDAKLIKKLSLLLKLSYDPLPPTNSSQCWAPDGEIIGNTSRENPWASQLGQPGLSPALYHVFQMRESVFYALAAMATFKDDLRKAIIDHGVVPFVVESLKPYTALADGSATPRNDNNEKLEKAGNPNYVLIAACNAATALSRSVSTLRTSLVDAGLAKPTFSLLNHPEIQVQIAATKTICNIVLDFSPMRQDIIDAGVLTILCEHAHSMNANLRLNSLWSLKHLVYVAPPSLRIKCLEELGPGWLKQIICNDSENLPSLSGQGLMPLTMETSNAAGEQVDLLNSVDDEVQNTMHQFEDDEEDEVNMIDSIGALSRPSAGRSQSSTHTDNKRYQPSFHSDEAETATQARRDDIAVQEQGLELVRNLTSCSDTKDGIMTDHLFRELGQEKLLGILTSLLRPKAVDAYTRARRSSGTGVKHVPPLKEIVLPIIYILVHIAGGPPRHRQLLLAQTELMRLVMLQFGHTSEDVRVACAFLVTNLTWIDDSADRAGSRLRALELKKMGILDRLEDLNNDPVLDVRERAKSAMSQLETLLKSDGGFDGRRG